MLKKAGLLLIAGILFLPSVARGDEVVTPLKKGDPAPFAGILLNEAAAARILAETDGDVDRCQIEKARDLEDQRIRMQLDNDIVTAKLDACVFLRREEADIAQERASQLEKIITQQKRPSTGVLVTGGILSGVALTLASAWAINLVGG